MEKDNKDTDKTSNVKKGPRLTWSTVILILVLVFCSALISTWLGFSAGVSKNSAGLSSTGNVTSGLFTGTMSAKDLTELKTNIETYVNDNLLLDESVEAKVIDVNDLGGGLYQLNYEIYQSGSLVSEGLFYESNGQLIIGQAFDLSKPLEIPETESESVSTEPVKSDKPKVDLYVMSFCPYGNLAENTFASDFNLLKDKIDFNVHFIVSVDGNNVSSLHGQPEVVQNEREACVVKYYGNQAWLDFAVYVNANCGSDGSCWEAGAKKFGIDTAKISKCVSEEGVALMRENADASSLAGANGSPTMIINGVNSAAVYQYGNSEEYKKAICGAFNTAPEECSVVLSSEASANTGGSC